MVVEFAICAVLFIALTMGIIDYGVMYQRRIANTNAAREGARWASTHADAWDSAAAPSLTSIQGRILNAADANTVSNSDSSINLDYYDASGSSPVLCGTWRISGGFSAQPSYTQTSCVASGNIVRISVTATYSFITPIASLLSVGNGTKTITGRAAMTIE